MDAAVSVKKEAHMEVEAEVLSLCQYVLSKHLNGFSKVVRQTEFLYKEVSTSDICFN